MAPMHTITHVTDLTTLQELATVSKAAENYLHNTFNKMWPAQKGSTMTLGKFYHLSPATASNFRREATAHLVKAITKTPTIGKNKTTSVSLKRTSTSLKRASTKAKRLTPPRKPTRTFKYTSTEIEDPTTAMVATNLPKDVATSTEVLVATQEASTVTEVFSPTTQEESTVTEPVAPMTQNASTSTGDRLVFSDAATMTEHAHSKTSDASTMTEDISNTIKKSTSTEINPASSGISSPITVLSTNQHSQERLAQEKKDSRLVAPELTLRSRKAAPVLIDITSLVNSSLTPKKQHKVPETVLSSRKATPVLMDLTPSTNFYLAPKEQHGTDESSSTVMVVRNVFHVRSGPAPASVVPTVSRADKEPKPPEKPQSSTMFTRATPIVPITTESPARKAWITAELKRREQDRTSPYQQATSDMIKRDAKAGLRNEFISYRNHTISTETIREQTTAAKRKRETDGDSDEKAVTTNTQNKKRKILFTMRSKVIAVSVLGLAVALSTPPASVPDWISTSVQMDFDALPPLGHCLPTAFSTAPPAIRDWFLSIPLDWPRWLTRKDPRS